MKHEILSNLNVLFQSFDENSNLDLILVLLEQSQNIRTQDIGGHDVWLHFAGKSWQDLGKNVNLQDDPRHSLTVKKSQSGC